MDVEAKICGLTRPADAAFAVERGAWRLGVIFAGGPRLVSIAQAGEIVSAAAGVPVLGVFGRRTIDSMLETLAATGLAGAQLHGSFDAQAASELRARGFEVWRVLGLSAATVPADVTAASVGVDALLVEAAAPGGSGGRGVVIPTDQARSARRAASTVPFVLAGGLTAESVAAAISAIRPDAVDVSSGIESSPGIKDHSRLARFLENVRAARSAA